MKKILYTTLLLLTGISVWADDAVKVVYNSDGTATVTIPSTIPATCSSGTSSNVVIVEDVTKKLEDCQYVISGTTTNGSLALTTYKPEITLNNLSMTSSGSALTITNSKRAHVILVGSNIIKDGGSSKVAMSFEGRPEFEGSGTLTVMPNGKNCIKSSKDMEINGGVFNIQPKKEGNAFSADGITVTAGTINLTISKEASKGINCGEDFIMTGGTITATASGDGSRVIKTDGAFKMSGGSITATLSGGNIEDEGDIDHCTGIKVANGDDPADMTVSGTAKIDITIANKDAEAYDTKGTFSVADNAAITLVGTKYAVKASDFTYDMRTYVKVTLDGKDFTQYDYRKCQIGAYVNGVLGGGSTTNINANGVYTYLPIRSNVATGTVTFKVYNYDDVEHEYDATNTIAFVSDGGEGSPSEPVALNISRTPGVDPKTSETLTLSGNWGDSDMLALSESLKNNSDITYVDFTGANVVTSTESLTSANPNMLIYLKEEGQSVGNTQNVVKGDVCEDFVITDGNIFGTSKEFTATNASYSRTMSNTWGTICLPYAVESNEDVAYYNITDASNGVLTIEKYTTLPKGTPALVKKLSGDKIDANAANVDVTGTIGDVTGNVTMKGNMGSSLKVTDANGYYIKNNQFWKCNEYFYIDAFRAYFTVTGNAAKFCVISIGEEAATAINALTGTSDVKVEGIYDANGVQQSSLQNGMNIIKLSNGKTQKVVIK